MAREENVVMAGTGLLETTKKKGMFGAAQKISD